MQISGGFSNTPQFNICFYSDPPIPTEQPKLEMLEFKSHLDGQKQK